MSVALPLDHAVRERIRHRLDENQWVEAAAGTGKTTVLIDRAVELLARGVDTVDGLVLVTFTRKAAGELELRLRQRLDQERLVAVGDDPASRARRACLTAAVEHLEEASIGTFHSFCTEVLRARPIAAGLDPDFVELDEDDAGRLFAQVFQQFLERKLDEMPPGLRRALARLAHKGGDDPPLARLAREAWQLAEMRDYQAPWRRPPFEREKDIDALLDRMTALLALRARGRSDDALHRGLAPLALFADQLAHQEELAGTRDYEEIEVALPGLARELGKNRKQLGRQADFAPGLPRTDVVAARDELLDALGDFVARADADLAVALREELQDVLADYAERKRALGRVDFLDLLLECRRLLREQPALCADLAGRFRHFLVDELQDTDPLQMEILLLLTSDDCAQRSPSPPFPADGERGENPSRGVAPPMAPLAAEPEEWGGPTAREPWVGSPYLGLTPQAGIGGALSASQGTNQEGARGAQPLEVGFSPLSPSQGRGGQGGEGSGPAFDWRDLRPRPGSLFLVGDPQQSIYRFRRADLALYQDMQARLREAGVAMLTLDHSFRANLELQRAINHAFTARLVADAELGQSAYTPLVGGRAAAGPALWALPVPRIRGYRGDVHGRVIEESLPDAVAALIARLLAEHYPLPGPAGPRPLEARDICLLFRRFQSWNRDVTADYLAALEARGVPHLLVGGRSFDDREEVETLKAALQAIEWPDDALSVYATLRGDLFGLTDDLLLRYREVGPLLPGSAAPPGIGAELKGVYEALDHLGQLHLRRNERPIAETLQQLLTFTRAHAGFALRPAGNQVLANVQRLIDLARRFELRAGLSFRGFVERLESPAERGLPGARTGGAPMLEEGADGVRLMTVHTAKGLEFPVVILVDPTCRLTGAEPTRHLDAGRGLCAQRLLDLAPLELQEAAALERGRDLAEAVRLTYVAATRARELLIVPAIGRSPGLFDGGWLSPLDAVVYPALGKAASGDRFDGAFGDDERLPAGDHPSRDGAGFVHVPALGARELERPPGMGVRGIELLMPAEGAGQAGLDRYFRWQARRADLLAQGALPSLEVIAVTETAQGPDQAALDTVSLPRPAVRPRGRRFGTLVHLLLRDLPHAGGRFDRAALPGLATLHGRLLAATAEEVVAARQTVAAALASPWLQEAERADELARELPFTLYRDGGFLIEGSLDLAYRTGSRWTVLDFKTDHPDDLDFETLENYRRQLAWYVEAVAATRHAAEARGVLLLI